MQRKRDRLARRPGATSASTVLPAHGTYFVTTDFRPLGFNGTDEDFCRHITVEAGVTAVPVSAFYDEPERAPRHFARFCFCKHDATLDSAIDRLGRHFRQVNQSLRSVLAGRRAALQSLQFAPPTVSSRIYLYCISAIAKILQRPAETNMQVHVEACRRHEPRR